MLLVPFDPLRPRRPDPHFAAEYAAAREAGVPVGLVDHDALAAGGDGAVAVAAVAGPADAAVYRGWMLSSMHYATMARALADRGVVLRTGPEQYRRAHEFPGWYGVFRDLTPESTWTTGDSRAEFERACRVLVSGPAVLRDFVKSAKAHWHAAMYVPEVADLDAAWAVATALREHRGEDFTGGFVVRRFESFTGPEARTWWVHGRCVALTSHPDTPAAPPPDPGPALALLLAPAVQALRLPFVTVDVVAGGDGRLRVVEVGDGQVSDRPEGTDAAAFVTAVLSGAGVTSRSVRPGPV